MAKRLTVYQIEKLYQDEEGSTSILWWLLVKDQLFETIELVPLSKPQANLLLAHYMTSQPEELMGKEFHCVNQENATTAFNYLLKLLKEKTTTQ